MINKTHSKSWIVGLLMATFFVSFLNSAQATMPVIDYAAIAEIVNELNQLKEQYKVLQQSQRELEKQLTEAQHLVSNSQGHYKFGSLLNSRSDLTARQWSPRDWESALKGLSGGNNARYKQLIENYQLNHPTLSRNEFEQGGTPAQAEQYERQSQVYRAAAVNATYAFNEIEQRLANIHTLSEKIEQSPNTKASIDLSARLLAEIAYIQVQELKLQALMNEQLAQQGAEDLFDQSQRVRFNTVKDY